MFAVFSIPFVVLNDDSCCVIFRSLSHVGICHMIREEVTHKLGLNAAYVTLARMFIRVQTLYWSVKYFDDQF